MSEPIVLYTTSDIAHRLGIANNRTLTWDRRGHLPEPVARTAGGRPLWSEKQVDEFIHFRMEWVIANFKRRRSKTTFEWNPETSEVKTRELPPTTDEFTTRQLEIAMKALEGSMS
jgi:DNA-binding transcriptional MerR regulator